MKKRVRKKVEMMRREWPWRKSEESREGNSITYLLLE